MRKANLKITLSVLLLLFSPMSLALDFSLDVNSTDARQISLLHKDKIFGRAYKAPGNCMRGNPMPVLSKDMPEVVSYYYEAFSPVNSIETVILADGGSITALHWGCEYYAINLFYTFSHTGKELDTASAYRLGSRLLVRLNRLGVDTVFDLPLSAATLRRVAMNPMGEPCVLGCAVEGDGTDFLQSRVDVEDYGVMANAGIQYIQVGFNKGPL